MKYMHSENKNIIEEVRLPALARSLARSIHVSECVAMIRTLNDVSMKKPFVLLT